MSTKVSILLPAYNESEIIDSDLPDFLKWLDEEFTSTYELVLIENGSTDGTYEKSVKLSKKYPALKVYHRDEAGFGGAVLESIARAKGEVGVLLNADWLDRDFVKLAVKEIKGNDIVIGSKVLNSHTDHRPLVRRLASHLLTFVLKTFFGFSFSDSHGLKAFRTSRIQPLAIQCKMNEIVESELLLLAQLHLFRITEVPVAITEMRAPRVSFARRILSMGGELVKLYRIRKEHLRALSR
jgi:dolichyl-phosphate beta-glucosyltransferase